MFCLTAYGWPSGRRVNQHQQQRLAAIIIINPFPFLYFFHLLRQQYIYLCHHGILKTLVANDHAYLVHYWALLISLIDYYHDVRLPYGPNRREVFVAKYLLCNFQVLKNIHSLYI